MYFLTSTPITKVMAATPRLIKAISRNRFQKGKFLATDI